VVKANAYGHGLLGVAQTLAGDAQLFGVANLQEALTLRESLSHPIVIFGPATPEERSVITEHGFIPTISSLEEAEAFNRFGPVAINFKIDTGMGRMGVVEHQALEVSETVEAGNYMEDAHLSRARYAERKLHQLWPHLHHSARNAGRNFVGWLR